MKGLFRFQLSLLTLLAVFLSVPLEAAKPAKSKTLDIADTITTGRITTKFAQMLQASDMATFLSSRGPFTIFVPTDSAFSKLPPGMLETLLLPENKERLQAIVLYHVVNGKRLGAKDFITNPNLLSCQGAPLTIHANKSGTQFVMKAKIVHADIRCVNGTVNQIDTVLMPPEKLLPPLAAPPVPAPADTNAPSAVAPTDTNAAPVEPVALPVTPAAQAN